jgi:hypothetical protein
MTNLVVSLWSSLGYRPVIVVQTAVAVAGTLVFAWDLIAHAKKSGDRYKRTRDWLIAVLGVAAFLCWWNLGRFHYPG